MVLELDTPLCPAGHLPLKGGDWMRRAYRPTFAIAGSGHVAFVDKRYRESPISPLEGEMSRSDRGGCEPLRQRP